MRRINPHLDPYFGGEWVGPVIGRVLCFFPIKGGGGPGR